MKVYVVLKCEYDNHEAMCVFSSKEQAEIFEKKDRRYVVEEVELDPSFELPPKTKYLEAEVVDFDAITVNEKEGYGINPGSYRVNKTNVFRSTEGTEQLIYCISEFRKWVHIHQAMREGGTNI